ncbi:MAG TPA: hypothetical protein VH575_12295 [Gemmataceae bacterium]
MIKCNEAETKRFQMEVFKCRKSFAYFCVTYCQILSDRGQGGDWVPFRLWPEQRRMAQLLQENRLVVVLKARQLGLTWLVLAFALWLLLFHPIATVLLFSRRDDEATDLLAMRLRGMYDRLPAFLKASRFTADNDHEWALASGSRALAFPTTAGDSYTATLAVVDEADLCPDLDRLMRAVKPTIDGGGRMVLLSRADKTKPLSPFKRIYQGARQGQNEWVPVFLPWHARPDRDAAWYEAQQQDIFSRTGAVDDLHEQYPATDAEALAPRSLDKRLPAEWLKRCYCPVAFGGAVAVGSVAVGQPALPGLTVYAVPVVGRRYVVGADPAEGNPTSDESALEVLDVDSGEEVASLAGRFEPATFAAHVDAVGRWYNHARVLVERNNHGHAVLLWLHENSRLLQLCGDDGKPGWNTTTKSKAALYAEAGEALRDEEAIIHGLETFSQLASVEGATLRAPDGQPDDRAVAFVLALAGRAKLLRWGLVDENGGPYVLTPGYGDLWGLDGARAAPRGGALGYRGGDCW